MVCNMMFLLYPGTLQGMHLPTFVSNLLEIDIDPKETYSFLCCDLHVFPSESQILREMEQQV